MACKGKGKKSTPKKAVVKKKHKKSGPSRTDSSRANGGTRKLRS